MTEMIAASFDEVLAFKITLQVLQFIIDKWIAVSKQRKALDDYRIALSRSEAQARTLAYALIVAFAAVLIGSMFFTIAPRSRC